MTVFFSTLVYALGKELGLQSAIEELHRQVKDTTSESLPVARTIRRVMTLDSVGLFVDSAATSIAKARCRAFHEAHKSKADVWVSCDDDIEATAPTLASLLEVVTQPKPVVCFAPCLLRGRSIVNVRLCTYPNDTTWPWCNVRTVGVLAAGCGLFAVNRAALDLLADCALHFFDDDGALKPALFYENLEGESWLGEDLSFCARASLYGVRLEALTDGVTVHAGQGLLLSEFEGMPGL